MPPIRKIEESDKQKMSSPPYLSRSANSASLKSEINKVKANLSKSCFGAIRTAKGESDNDLTSLNWLSRNDVLRGFDVGATVPPMSPPHDAEGDLSNELIANGLSNGSACPDGLSGKRKSPSKPPYSFSSLIFMAIEESPNKRLPVKDIYNWIMDHFPYFRDARLGWKNSVRHNLSLNKCFKKVDKDKGQNVGKGSLWTVDPDFRPNLLQALRKTPSYNNFHHLLSTPPPSPKNGHTLKSPNCGQYDSSDVDPDAEAEAVATMCLIATPPALRAAEIVRCQSCPPSATEQDSLVKRAKEYFYKHRGSFSGSPTMVKDFAIKRRKIYGLSASMGRIESPKFKNRKSISPDSSLDGEFEFDHESASEEDDDEDSEVDEAMQNVIKRDELYDSGYGQDFGRDPDTEETKPKKIKSEKLNDYAGADALLSLANTACSLIGSRDSSRTSSPAHTPSPRPVLASS
ncbi:forkhead box protein N2 [Nematostella vectensis]|nr:forkhead box protein N2 [Nematostella vectensis]XP_048579903.1 forkhead box protein N2 [Nematostella vectensis]XP_048579904.1 forkhead box protein N2 [Nematostella vectensis]XP_048579905.1 forkhead box protein N2 [Nematostella vectensis]